MDYVFCIAFASFFALIYSVFTSFIASRSGRSIYRKIMWAYLITLAIAATVITVLQLPSEWLAFGAALTSAPAVFLQFAIAAKLGHLIATNSQYRGSWDRYTRPNDSISPDRMGANSFSYDARYDPLRRR